MEFTGILAVQDQLGVLRPELDEDLGVVGKWEGKKKRGSQKKPSSTTATISMLCPWRRRSRASPHTKVMKTALPPPLLARGVGPKVGLTENGSNLSGSVEH